MPAEDEALQKFLKDMQAKGYIQSSKSPYASLHHPSFLFEKRMANSDLFKTIAKSMSLQ
jgi:hypothetical protein